MKKILKLSYTIGSLLFFSQLNAVKEVKVPLGQITPEGMVQIINEEREKFEQDLKSPVNVALMNAEKRTNPEMDEPKFELQLDLTARQFTNQCMQESILPIIVIALEHNIKIAVAYTEFNIQNIMQLVETQVFYRLDLSTKTLSFGEALQLMEFLQDRPNTPRLKLSIQLFPIESNSPYYGHVRCRFYSLIETRNYDVNITQKIF